MKFGIIREGKVPPDSRAPLTPAQCRQVLDQFPAELAVQPSQVRCFADGDFRAFRIPLQDDLSDCDVLLGVKEVPVGQLIPEKTYLFFSHTIKAQPYNRKLLQKILELNIRLIDYEVLTDADGRRLIDFGRFAGIVGAHNALFTYGRRTGAFMLPRMKDLHEYAQARAVYDELELPPLRIVLTGTGRVGMGAAEVLNAMGIRKVTPRDFLHRHFDEAVYTQLQETDYAAHRQGPAFTIGDFHRNPEAFVSAFAPFARAADIFINGIYWDNRAPAFFTKAEMRRPDFNIRVIADITCDIAPAASIPSTLRPTTIAEPCFGYDPVSETEAAPFQDHVIDMMTIDNLPNELPRDASRAFGEQLIGSILPEFFTPNSHLLERATIAEGGKLGPHFTYLHDYCFAR